MAEQIILERKKLDTSVRAGVYWIYIAGIVSLLNSFLFLMVGLDTNFPPGLSVTHFLDRIAYDIAQTTGYSREIVYGLTFVADLAVCLMLISAGYLARKGNKAIYIGGFVFFLVCFLLSLNFRYFLGAFFHGYVLLVLAQGFFSLARLIEFDKRYARATIPDLEKMKAMEATEVNPVKPALIIITVVVILGFMCFAYLKISGG
jgi:hypothetical protein